MDTPTTEIYTLSLHDALPICPLASPIVRVRVSQAAQRVRQQRPHPPLPRQRDTLPVGFGRCWRTRRSEEHTSELQSHVNLVCRLLLEKKKKASHITTPASQFN